MTKYSSMKKVVKTVLLVIPIIYLLHVITFFSKSTEEIITFFYVNNESQFIPLGLSYKYLELVEYDYLVEKSSSKKNSLLVSSINLAFALKPDEISFYKVLDIITSKNGVSGLISEKCMFLDQLVLMGDTKLVEYLISKGLVIPSKQEQIAMCDRTLLSILNEYSFRFDDTTKTKMINLLESY